jgi:hypothetical protein
MLTCALSFRCWWNIESLNRDLKVNHSCDICCAVLQVLVELEPAPHQATELSGDAGAVGRIIVDAEAGTDLATRAHTLVAVLLAQEAVMQRLVSWGSVCEWAPYFPHVYPASCCCI